MELYTLKKVHHSLPSMVTAMRVLANSEDEARRLAQAADGGSYVWLTGHVTSDASPVHGTAAIVGFNFLAEEPEVCPLIPSVVDVTKRHW